MPPRSNVRCRAPPSSSPAAEHNPFDHSGYPETVAPVWSKNSAELQLAGTMGLQPHRRMRCRPAEEFVAHYHAERNQQGLDHRIIQPSTKVGQGPARWIALSGWVGCSNTSIVKPPKAAPSANQLHDCSTTSLPFCPALHFTDRKTRARPRFRIRTATKHRRSLYSALDSIF